jgi:hypothetical protein
MMESVSKSMEDVAGSTHKQIVRSNNLFSTDYTAHTFIHDEKLATAHKSAGQGKDLPLAYGQVLTTGRDFRVKVNASAVAFSMQREKPRRS